MRKLIFLLFLSAFTKSMAHPDSLTFAVLGNSISTYYDYIPSGYSVYYSQAREKSYGIQVGDVEEEVGEPVVFGDEVAYVDKSDVEIGEENAVLYAACSDLTYGARSKEIEGVEDGREEVQTYAGPIGPIGF